MLTKLKWQDAIKLQEDEDQFLCVDKHDRCFVSSIANTKPDWSLKPNYLGYCYYVDDIASKMIIPIDELKSIWLINGEKE